MGDNVTKNMREAFSWYEYALKKTDELAKNGAQKLDLDSGVTTDEEAPDLPPSYQLRAHLGEILEVSNVCCYLYPLDLRMFLASTLNSSRALFFCTLT